MNNLLEEMQFGNDADESSSKTGLYIPISDSDLRGCICKKLRVSIEVLNMKR